MKKNESDVVMQNCIREGVSTASTGASAAMAGGTFVGVGATMVNASLPTVAIAAVEGIPIFGGVGAVVAGGIATAVTVATPVVAAVGVFYGAKKFFSWLTDISMCR